MHDTTFTPFDIDETFDTNKPINCTVLRTADKNNKKKKVKRLSPADFDQFQGTQMVMMMNKVGFISKRNDFTVVKQSSLAKVFLTNNRKLRASNSGEQN